MASASDASQLLREGQSHFFAEPPDYAAAEKAYRAAISVSPEWGEPFHWLGSVLESQGSLHEAADAYPRAIDLLTGDPPALIALCRLQSLCRPYREGIKLRPTRIN